MKMKRCTSNRVNEVHCSSPYYFWTASLVVSLLLLFTPPSCNAENPLQIVEDICPIGSAVQLVNRTIWFTDLPSRDNDIDPSYDAGAIGNWFLVAREFVNVVKEENLPYGIFMSRRSVCTSYRSNYEHKLCSKLQQNRVYNYVDTVH